VYRALLFAAAAAALAPAGCGTMWDAVTSRQFRSEPFTTVKNVVVPEDPMTVLRADPPRSGDDRAKAMHRLKEPIRNGYSQQDHDQIVEMLERTATADKSPVLRYAAIDALGRFEDERATRILMLAYQKADGQTEQQIKGPAEVVPVGGLSAGRAPTKSGIEVVQLVGPTGYSPDTVAALRCRCLESLGRTHKPEAARFLATVAGTGGADITQIGAEDIEVRQAAVRGLGQCRQPEAVAALAQVLAAEAGKDPTLARGAHAGLVRLTGKRLPPDPQQWNAVVQAGVVIAPEPTWAEDFIENAAFWQKK
jgi:hypothetical protein